VHRRLDFNIIVHILMHATSQIVVSRFSESQCLVTTLSYSGDTWALFHGSLSIWITLWNGRIKHHVFQFVIILIKLFSIRINSFSDLLFQSFPSILHQLNLCDIKQRQEPPLELSVMSLDTIVRSNRNDRDHWVHPEEHPCVKISIHSVKFFVLIFQRLFKN